MRLIHCQGGNEASARLAVKSGWWYGFRSDDSHHAAAIGPVALLDSHWVNPRWQKHLDVAAEVRPWMATVPDTMSLSELDRTVRQAEELAPYTENILIVPKWQGVIARLPREVGGRRVVLGYSIPTSYGGTGVSLWDFEGWPVHLLGGNARRQAAYSTSLNAVSADGNLAWMLARRGIVVTERGTAGKTIRQLDGERWPHTDAPLEAFRRSLVNLRVFWSKKKAINWR